MKQTFEWDEAKSDSNSVKHGITFSEARLAFFDPFSLRLPDPRHSLEEERFILLGFATHKLLTVSYTERGSSIRIISCRKATTKERRLYEESNRR